MRQRYQLCEDLAQALTERAATARFKSGEAECEVLEKIRCALTTAESHVQPPEAAWIVRRLAELLDWKLPQAE